MLRLLNSSFSNFTVRDSGISYDKKIGDMFSSGNVSRMALQQAKGMPATDVRKSVNVTRLIIERRLGSLMPDLGLLVREFAVFKREADAETREYFSLNRNNHGNLLMELPSRSRNIAVAEKFLKWLDTRIKEVAHG